MPKTQRVALMLDLEWPLKRHVGVFNGAQKYAQSHGWQTFIDNCVPVAKPSQSVKPPVYDGVIARATRKLALHSARLHLPLVNVWRSSPVWKLLPGVFPDFSAIGTLRAEHLLSRGLRRFAAFIRKSDQGQGMELDAFVESLAKAGYACAATKLPLSASPDIDWQKFERMLSRCMEKWVPPIGVFIGSDMDGRIVTQKCLNRGWRVPEDVAIIAGKNEETYCEGLRPTISSVEMDYERVGYESAKLLDGLMNGEAPPVEPILIPPKALIVRESTDVYSVNDAVISAALDFIAKNFQKPIGQDEVALALATELRPLQIRFQKQLGSTISAEIRRARIEQAKRDLAQSERSLKEIAHEVGFGEAMQMYKTFVRELGITPRKYRQERRTARERR